MSHDRIQTRNNVLIQVLRNGRVVDQRERHNLVVAAGKADIAERLVVIPTTVYGFMQVGTSATAAGSGQTALLAIVPNSNKACDVAEVTSPGLLTFERTWLTTDFTASGISEAGIFDALAPGEGTMLARVTFSPVTKTSADTLKITWTVEIT